MFYYGGVSIQRVSFDSAQLLQLIGPGLYADAMAFLEELLRNSFNADAVHVTLTSRTAAGRRHLKYLEILDDGHGMSPSEVRRYFGRVGTDSARRQPFSPSGRRKMGGHGIGRFSAFAVCGRMELFTRRAGGAVTAVRLAREKLFQNPPLTEVEQLANPSIEGALGEQGTLIRLYDFHRPLRREQIIRRVLAKFTREFFSQVAVEVDHQRITKHWPEPHRIYRLPQDFPPEVLRGLPASFRGELVYVDNPHQLLSEEAGVALAVGGTTICVERVGIEASPRQSLHLAGTVTVDHMRHLQNSSRTGFQTQSREYRALLAALSRAAAAVFEREGERARSLADAAEAKALQSVLDRIIRPLQRSLQGRADFEGLAGPASPKPRSQTVDHSGSSAKDLPGETRPSHRIEPPLAARNASEPEPPQRSRHLSLQVRGAYLGSDESAPEAVLEADSQLTLNLEHPLYRVARQHPHALAYHCARLITQELALRLAAPGADAQEVLALQSELMSTALAHSQTNQAERVA